MRGNETVGVVLLLVAVVMVTATALDTEEEIVTVRPFELNRVRLLEGPLTLILPAACS